MNKIYLRYIVIILILLFALSACSPAPKEEPQQPAQPTQVQEKPTEQPPTLAPQPSPSPIPPTAVPAPALPTEAPTLEAPSKAAQDDNAPYCAGEKVHLNIANINSADDSPDEGWCAEACVQMSMGFFGKNISQNEINRAGSPSGHPDLWNDDIDKALKTLNVEYDPWTETSKDVKPYLRWITNHLQAGHPVLLAVKIYPDEEPGWDVDHYILAVGCDEKGLIVNTNIEDEGQQYYSYEEMTTNFYDSYSLVNNFDTQYARAIIGLK